MKEKSCETHKSCVDEKYPVALIGFNLKCSPPNRHPFTILIQFSSLGRDLYMTHT